MANTFNVSPRAGFAYDLTGDNRTVVKGYYGRFYFNSADTLADLENPVGSARLRYRFNDLNGNRLLDGPQELGTFNSVQGGAGFVNVDDNIKRPYSQEFSGAPRARNRHRPVGPHVLRLQAGARRVGGNRSDTARPRSPSRSRSSTSAPTASAAPPTTRRLPCWIGRPPRRRRALFTNPTDPAYNSDFQTVEFAINRRFAGRWMLLTSFGYTWLDQFHAVTTNTGALDAAGPGQVRTTGGRTSASTATTARKPRRCGTTR